MNFNVVIATPSSGQCRTSFAFSLARLVSYFAMNRIYPEVEQQQLDFLLLEGSGICANREDMTRTALEKKDMTHLLFIDDDMGFNVDTLHILASRRQPIASCNYRMRVPPADFTALKADKTARIQTTIDSKGLEEAYYSGFGFCLIERKVLEAVKEPRYWPQYDPSTGRYTTEDFPFFHAAREAGFPCWIDHDASKNIWHSGNINYVWSESFESLNKGFEKPKEQKEKSKPDLTMFEDTNGK